MFVGAYWGPRNETQGLAIGRPLFHLVGLEWSHYGAQPKTARNPGLPRR